MSRVERFGPLLGFALALWTWGYFVKVAVALGPEPARTFSGNLPLYIPWALLAASIAWPQGRPVLLTWALTMFAGSTFFLAQVSLHAVLPALAVAAWLLLRLSPQERLVGLLYVLPVVLEGGSWSAFDPWTLHVQVAGTVAATVVALLLLPPASSWRLALHGLLAGLTLGALAYGLYAIVLHVTSGDAWGMVGAAGLAGGSALALLWLWRHRTLAGLAPWHVEAPFAMPHLGRWRPLAA